jgi:formylglycine-generating enzyme required for sulfatase activity
MAMLTVTTACLLLSATTAVPTPPPLADDKRGLGLRIASPDGISPRDDQRKALVIGNGKYQGSPLKNTINDARAVSDALRGVGFRVVLEKDTDLKTLRRTLGAFVDTVQKEDVVVFYYAGHGIEIEGTNYLVPVDFKADRSTDVPYEAYPMNQFLDAMEQRGPAVNVVILDACRNNPYTSGTRAFGKRGLAEVRAGTGSLIAYATSPGKTAGDGDGRNGVFTESLVRFLHQPGMDIEAMFKEVSDDVAIKTGREQIPWRSSSIVGKYYLAGAPVAGVSPAGEPGPRRSRQPVLSELSGLTYAWIPGGVFQAGCPAGRSPCDPDEFPARTVNLGGFYLSTTEVTVAAYAHCVSAGGCKPLQQPQDTDATNCNAARSDRGEHPVNCITWEEAQTFCMWDGGRLPSPDEWEFAASGGGSALFPWGLDPPDEQKVNYCDKRCPEAVTPRDRDLYVSRGWADPRRDDSWAGTAPVGSYPAGANRWGVRDLLGNVAEWTSGAYNASTKEVRGGDWATTLSSLRATNRTKSVPGFRSDLFGARCAR